MFRHILVPATGAQSDALVFRTALALARPFGSHLAFLHVRLDMQHALLAMAGADLGNGGYGGVVDSVQHEVEARERRAHEAVATFCDRAGAALNVAPSGGLSASWHVEAGDEAPWLAAYARTADVTVLSRGGNGQKAALHLMETVLLESGRPLLVAPDTAWDSVGRRIAIAWRDTAEAGHAVAAALPLLAHAESVTVVAVQENADTHAEGESGLRLRDALCWHNPATSLRVLPRSNREPVDALLAAIEADGTDLLVMGGYGHSRLREAVFGGFTRSVLYAANLPVLIAH